MGGGGEREGMVDGGGGLRVGKKNESVYTHFRTNM